MTLLVERPLKYHLGKKFPIQDVLMDLASQENCDGDPYDQMVEASKHITELEKEVQRLRAVIQEAADYHQGYVDKLATTDPERSIRQNIRVCILKAALQPQDISK